MRPADPALVMSDEPTTTVVELFKTKVITPRLFHTNSGSGEPEAPGPSTASAGPSTASAGPSTASGVTSSAAGKRHKSTSEQPLLLSLPTIVLERVSSKLRPHDFRSFAMLCAEMHHALGRIAPGMTASAARGALELRDFQASNVRILTEQLLGGGASSGMVLCDPPGAGKTLTVLATIVRTMPAPRPPAERRGKSQVLIFAPSTIVAQWANQILLHFDTAVVPELRTYCADNDLLGYASAATKPSEGSDGASAEAKRVQPLSERPAGSGGGVYVERRSAAVFPPLEVLRSFDVVLVAKEMLSRREDPWTAGLKAADRKRPSIAALYDLIPTLRLCVIDESHNMNKGAMGNQSLNVDLLTRGGVPTILMSGTPGCDPRHLYRMLAIIHHPSYRKAGGERKWRKARFCDGVAEGRVRAEAREQLEVELRSCFLQTTDRAQIFPNETAAPQRRLEMIAPSDAEELSHNFVLSLHQRDVLRAGATATRPAEWPAHQARGEQGEVRAVSRSWQDELASRWRPSAEKTCELLQKACNGAADEWVVQPRAPAAQWQRAVTDGTAPAHVVKAVTRGGELPQCAWCGVTAPGLVAMPCRCEGAVCVECLRDDLAESGGFGAQRCAECGGARDAHGVWARREPGLLLKSREGIDEEDNERTTRATQVQLRRETGTYAVLRQQPKPLVFAPEVEAAAPALDAISLDEIAARTEGHAKAAHVAAFLKRQGGGAEGLKVLVVPPADPDVRATFTRLLTDAIGADAVADMNGRGAKELAQVVAKFKDGHGRSWQCAKCGEVHEQAVPKCQSQIVKIKIDRDPAADANFQAMNPDKPLPPAVEELRFLQDVAKVDRLTGDVRHGEKLYIGDAVRVRTPGAPASSFAYAPRGRLVAVGNCNGKRPTARSTSGWVRGAQDSCFVLVLNQSGIEGLDLGEATHLIKLEPMRREDKEQQAEARGTRMGGTTSLQIVQLLMRGTIEEALHAQIDEERQQGAATKRQRGGGSGGGSGDVVEPAEEGKQARLLNSLKLLRPPEVEEEQAGGSAGAAP